MHIGWPEGILIAGTFIELSCVAIVNGNPRTDKWNFAAKFMSSIGLFGLLYWGGFFA